MPVTLLNKLVLGTCLDRTLVSTFKVPTDRSATTIRQRISTIPMKMHFSIVPTAPIEEVVASLMSVGTFMTYVFI